MFDSLTLIGEVRVRQLFSLLSYRLSGDEVNLFIAIEERKRRLNEIRRLQQGLWNMRDELDFECRREGFDWDAMNSRLRLREDVVEKDHLVCL